MILSTNDRLHRLPGRLRELGTWKLRGNGIAYSTLAVTGTLTAVLWALWLVPFTAPVAYGVLALAFRCPILEWWEPTRKNLAGTAGAGVLAWVVMEGARPSQPWQQAGVIALITAGLASGLVLGRIGERGFLAVLDLWRLEGVSFVAWRRSKALGTRTSTVLVKARRGGESR